MQNVQQEYFVNIILKKRLFWKNREFYVDLRVEHHPVFISWYCIQLSQKKKKKS